jgi:hypothetical protein
MGAVSSTGLEKRIKSWLSSVSSQDKKPVSMLSLASKQKCDFAAHAVAVVHTPLIPDEMAAKRWKQVTS